MKDIEAVNALKLVSLYAIFGIGLHSVLYIMLKRKRWNSYVFYVNILAAIVPEIYSLAKSARL